MKQIYFFIFALVFTSGMMAQPAVRGKLTLYAPMHDRDFIVRHTKVILATKTSRDTVAVNDKLEFEFVNPAPGKAVLYLSSPVLPSHTEYTFRIKKKKPTSVSLQYDRFQTQRVKTAEEQEEDVAAGFFIARLALDLVVFIHAVTR